MDKTTYTIIAGPGSLLDPPDGTPVVWFSELAGEEDGRSWCVQARPGVVNRYHKQRFALKAASDG